MNYVNILLMPFSLHYKAFKDKGYAFFSSLVYSCHLEPSTQVLNKCVF